MVTDKSEWEIYKGTIFSMQDPRAWITMNPDSLLNVRCVNLELPDEVEEISDSIGSLRYLRRLNIRRGTSLKYLPHALTKLLLLDELSINNCPVLVELPSFLGQLFNLETLSVRNCGIKSLPDILAIEGCASLVDLTIINCHMKSIKTTGLTKLGCLRINNCELLEDLCTDLNSLVRLETLTIEKCINFKLLPSLAALHTLHGLSLEGCKSLNELPSDFDKLAKLSVLKLKDTNLQSFPSTINSIMKLPFLELLYLPLSFRLETLPQDLNFNWITVYIPLGFKLPANYSATDKGVYLKVQKNYNLEEMMSQDLFIEQTTIKTPFNTTNLRQLHPDDGLNVIGETTSYHTLLTPEDRSSVNPDERHRSLELTEGVESHAYDKGIENQAMLCDEYSPTDPVMREDAAARELSNDEIAGETTNQQAPSSLGGKTLESEGEGDGPLGLIELSDSSANGAETDKCLPSSQDDNNTPARKGKRAQKTITTEQNRSPTGKKDAHRKTKINKEEVLQLLIDSNLTRKAAAARLNVSPSTFNQYLRMESIKWPHRRATKRLQRGCEGINRLDHRATKRLQTDHTAKPILNNFVIKAEYEEDVVKFECSTSTSIDELRDIVGKKFNLDQQAFKLKYLDETNEMILMVDTSDIVGAFEAAIEKNEKFVRILVL